MNAVLDNFLVGALVLLSLGYAAYKLGPRHFRTRILKAASRAMSADVQPLLQAEASFTAEHPSAEPL